MKVELKRNSKNVPYLVFTRESDGQTRSVAVSDDELNSLRKQIALDMNEMTFGRYQELRRQTDKYSDVEAPYCHALGLGSEAGEVLGKIDKLYRKTHKFEPDEEQKEAISKEIGDCLWYLSGCADDIGYPLEKIASDNIMKLADRDKRNVIATFDGGDDR